MSIKSIVLYLVKGWVKILLSMMQNEHLYPWDNQSTLANVTWCKCVVIWVTLKWIWLHSTNEHLNVFKKWTILKDLLQKINCSKCFVTCLIFLWLVFTTQNLHLYPWDNPSTLANVTWCKCVVIWVTLKWIWFHSTNEHLNVFF